VQAAPGLVIHTAGPLERDALAGILRSAANARAALGQETSIEVVIQGPCVRFITTDSTAREDINNALQQNIRLCACGNSMRPASLEEGDLAAGVSVVPAAIANTDTEMSQVPCTELHSAQ
jgi:intracellular sulfur oxidation DsrE/DsrF family protein